MRSNEQIETHHEKTRLWSFRIDQTQTRLYKYRKWLELRNICIYDRLNIDIINFDHMVHRIYPAELQLNKANASDTEAPF